MTFTFDSKKTAFTCQDGLFILTVDDSEARRILAKYVAHERHPALELCSVSDLARRYGFGEKKVRSWIADDGCPFFRVDSDVRFDAHQVDRWFVEKFAMNQTDRKTGTIRP